MESIVGNREKILIKTSVIGIAANLFLAAIKAALGLFSHSIAIVLDAVNNISDVASSVITIIGARLAGKEPDKKHPFGHGRVEYMSALLIAVLILYAGITSLIESVKKIIHPVTPEYVPVSLILLVIAILVKVVLGLYVRKTGRSIKSDSLINSGTDALNDSVISAATLIAAIVYIATRVSIEAWLGAVISIIILKSGADMIMETVSKLLGEPGDVDTVKKIKSVVSSFPEVRGVFDMVLHNYGPDIYTGSIHIEVDDKMSMRRLDILTRSITDKVYEECGVFLTGVSIYAICSDPEIMKIRKEVSEMAMSHQYVRQIHGFFADKEKRELQFDCVVSYDAGSLRGVVAGVREDVEKRFPDYRVKVNLDTDYNEL